MIFMKNIESEIFKNKIKMSLQGIGAIGLGSLAGVCSVIVYRVGDYLIQNQGTPEQYSILITAGVANAVSLAFTCNLFVHARDSYLEIKKLRQKQKVGELCGNEEEYF